jgi:signal transduction histidine kinase
MNRAHSYCRGAIYAALLAFLMLCGACWGQSFKGLVTQEVWLDASQTADIAQATQAQYIPLRLNQRYPLTTHDLWLRLRYTGQPNSDALNRQKNVSFILRPMLFTSVTLYKANQASGQEWEAQEISADTQLKPIDLGKLQDNEEIYIKIKSSAYVFITFLIDTQEKIKQLEPLLTIGFNSISSILLCISFIFLISLGNRFDWAKLSISFLSLMMAINIIGQSGILHIIINVEQVYFAKAMDAAYFLLHFGLVLLITSIWKKLFKTIQNFDLNVYTLTPYLVIIVYSIYDLDLALYISNEYRWVLNSLLTFFCILQTIRWRKIKRLKIENITIFITVALCIIMSIISSPFINSELIHLTNESFIDPITKFFLRISVPLSLIFMVYFLSVKAEKLRSAELNIQVDTTQSKLELETFRLNKQRQLTGMLAHELKNPLMSSQLALSSIQKRLDPNDPALIRAASIQSSLDEIDKIIERCVEADSFEHGQTPVKFSIFGVDQLINVVESGQNMERLYVLQRGVDSNTLIQSDFQYVLIILKNLISNALKYSPPNSLVELLIRPAYQHIGQGLLFSVSNEVGPTGLPDPAKVFERYYRGEGALNQSGAGLGLWLAQEMAGNLATKIELQVSPPKVTFSFFLPLTPAAA